MPPESIFECSICYQNFNYDKNCPKVLPCGHTFCNSCLLAVKKTENNIETVQCFKCRLKSDWSRLVSNFIILSNLDEAPSHKTSSSVPPHFPGHPNFTQQHSWSSWNIPQINTQLFHCNNCSITVMRHSQSNELNCTTNHFEVTKDGVIIKRTHESSWPHNSPNQPSSSQNSSANQRHENNKK